jgi:hypothetical protein
VECGYLERCHHREAAARYNIRGGTRWPCWWVTSIPFRCLKRNDERSKLLESRQCEGADMEEMGDGRKADKVWTVMSCGCD